MNVSMTDQPISPERTSRDDVTADELIEVALRRLDQTMLYLLLDLDGVLTPDQRHRVRDLVTPVWGCLRTHQHLYARGAG